MAFAPSSSCPKSSFQVGLHPMHTAAVTMPPRRPRKVVDAIRAIAMVPPLPKTAGMRCRPVSDTMATIKAKGKTAFIPHITAGDPDLATTAEALRVLDACGADVIELGMPFSDPYVDGPIIQASTARALAGGTTMDGVLGMLKEVTPELSCPVVLFSYYQPIFFHGLARIKDAGVHGLLVHDFPYVAADPLWSEAKNNNLELVLTTTPSTPQERMKEITKASEGFVYLVSANGVTGPRENMNSHVQFLIQEVKKVTDKPVAVGFGISKPEHVKQIAHWGADGVIIGSAMVQQLGEAASPKEGLKRLEKIAMSMKNALP